MLQRILSPKDMTDQETRRLIEPASVGLVVLSIGLIWLELQDSPLTTTAKWVILCAASLIGYVVFLFVSSSRVPERLQRWKWLILALNSLCINLGFIVFPAELKFFIHMGLIFVTAITVIVWEHRIALLFIFASMLAPVWQIWAEKIPFGAMAHDIGFFVLALVIVETFRRLNQVNMNRIRRLESVNEFARQIGSSIEREKVIATVGEAIQKVMQADTFFLGSVQGDHILLHVIYDDGEYFEPATVPMAGSLSGWVVRNQRSLFIADMRLDVKLEGVQKILTGNNRDNECWMGVPMRTKHVDGLIAIASYRPYGFDRTDLELLEILAQHTALALDNAHHHTEVEEQSKRDSLTGVYNHGHIVQTLRNECEKAARDHTPVSLIMLDIDYFKQYNDNYGHQAGDNVLIALSNAVREHIKVTDALGRWGGEEFTIVLPGATGQQAMQIAVRIQKTIQSVKLTHRNQLLPFPTVSQGVAVFPFETNDVDQLIHIADQRLYVAKERGRNQVEPRPDHWDKIKAE